MIFQIIIVATLIYISHVITEMYKIQKETPQEKEIRINRRLIKNWGKKL